MDGVNKSRSEVFSQLLAIVKPIQRKEDRKTFKRRWREILADCYEPHNPRRWILIDGDARLPADADGEPGKEHDRVALLLLDRDGVPTFVEYVMEVDEGRLSLEDIAHGFDLIANAAAAVRATDLKKRVELRKESDVQIEIQRLRLKNLPEFWEKVDRNLSTGRIRLIFVATGAWPDFRQVLRPHQAQLNGLEVLFVWIGGLGLAYQQTRIVGRIGAALSS